MDIVDLPYEASIVITTYNQSQFLHSTLISAVQQSYKKKEIIVVDDCSKDNTAAIMKDLAGRSFPCPVSFYQTPSNMGTAGARNFGLSKTKGEFIGFLDGDDEYYKDKLAISVAKLAQFPHFGVAYSDYDIEYTAGERRGQTIRAYKPPFDAHSLLRGCIVSTNSVIWRRVFDRVGTFDESIRGMEDYEFWLRVSTKFGITHIPYSLFKYREHGQNKTSLISPKDWAKEEMEMKQRFVANYLGNRNV